MAISELSSKRLNNIELYGRENAVLLMNTLAAESVPFFFVVDYSREQSMVMPIDDLDPQCILYDFDGIGNSVGSKRITDQFVWNPTPLSLEEYKQSFDIVNLHLRRGDSYLVNLTCRVPIVTNLQLKDIYLASSARYRLWIDERMVCFSPETFVKIRDGRIFSFPMKGTIDANLPNANVRLLENEKEKAEHATIVDLIRNDLSMVADDVRVERYRYVERVMTNKGTLLQTSSEISGRLPRDYQCHIGDILFKLLPAGSITGAPKTKTVKIIAESEKYDRGFYTGVMGYCKDGLLDSAVMIRFIDKEDGKLFYKAGGGITAHSDCRNEYNEMIQKIYVPVC